MSELDHIWPIFQAEGREQVQALAAGVLELGEVRAPEAVLPLQRLTHTLKGSAASLGFAEIERVARAMEDVLRQVEDGHPLPPERIAAIVRGCEAIEASLTDAGRGRVNELEKVLADLGAARSASPPS